MFGTFDWIMNLFDTATLKRYWPNRRLRWAKEEIKKGKENMSVCVEDINDKIICQSRCKNKFVFGVSKNIQAWISTC